MLLTEFDDNLKRKLLRRLLVNNYQNCLAFTVGEAVSQKSVRDISNN